MPPGIPSLSCRPTRKRNRPHGRLRQAFALVGHTPATRDCRMNASRCAEQGKERRCTSRAVNNQRPRIQRVVLWPAFVTKVSRAEWLLSDTVHTTAWEEQPGSVGCTHEFEKGRTCPCGSTCNTTAHVQLAVRLGLALACFTLCLHTAAALGATEPL